MRKRVGFRAEKKGREFLVREKGIETDVWIVDKILEGIFLKKLSKENDLNR